MIKRACNSASDAFILTDKYLLAVPINSRFIYSVQRELDGLTGEYIWVLESNLASIQLL